MKFCASCACGGSSVASREPETMVDDIHPALTHNREYTIVSII